MTVGKKSRRSAPVQLRLYVAGQLPHSLTAIANLQRLRLDPALAGCEIEVVDVLREPERCLQDAIFVTPTLLRLTPEPALRIFGNLKDLEQVRLALAGPPPAGATHA